MKTRHIMWVFLGVLFVAASARAQDAGDAAGVQAADDPVASAVDAYYAAQGTAEETEALGDLGENLSAYQDPWIVNVLAESLRSDDSATRQAAMRSLYSGTAENPDLMDLAVLEQVRLTAEEEADPDARIQALEVLFRHDASREDVVALLETLAEEGDEGPVQDFALQKLQEIESADDPEPAASPGCE